MTLLPESTEDRARLLKLFVGEIQRRHKDKGGTIYGSYQILDWLEEIAIENGMVECPHCHRKGKG
jgi:hypothetical protein